MIYCEKLKIQKSNKYSSRLDSLFDISRFAYNFILAQCIRKGYSKARKPSLKAIYDIKKEYRSLVKEGLMIDRNGEVYPEEFQTLLQSQPSQISDNECKNVHHAFSTLKRNNIPRFKKRTEQKYSFTLHRKTESTFKLFEGNLQVSKMRFDISTSRFLTNANQVKLITLSKSQYGYYISITMEIPDDTFKQPPLQNAVGIDWGVKSFATDSDNNTFDFKQSRSFQKYVLLSKKLKEKQALLSWKRLHSNNWKSSKKYQRLKDSIKYIYEKLSNIRKDFLHKLSKYYVMNYQSISIEDLKPSNMLKNHKLARVIAEGMFYTWKVLLKYKAEWYGRDFFLKNPRNTSQTCSCCGTVLSNKLGLSQRIFICENPLCSLSIDRDYNASINILHA